jgi:hypothetical protein
MLEPRHLALEQRHAVPQRIHRPVASPLSHVSAARHPRLEQLRFGLERNQLNLRPVIHSNRHAPK